MNSKKQDLIDAASELFARYGFHGTGIDRITASAGVTKRTMYQHFRSKDELIIATLRDYDARFRSEFIKAVELRWHEPCDRLLGIFDIAEQWFADSSFYGCMFINAIGEYSEPDSTIRDVCNTFKQSIYRYILQLVDDCCGNGSESLARQIALLFEGAIVTAQVSGKSGAAMSAKAAAEILLQQEKKA